MSEDYAPEIEPPDVLDDQARAEGYDAPPSCLIAEYGRRQGT